MIDEGEGVVVGIDSCDRDVCFFLEKEVDIGFLAHHVFFVKAEDGVSRGGDAEDEGFVVGQDEI